MADTFSDRNKNALQHIEDITSNADEIQTRVLEEILSRNAHVDYLQRHGLNGRTDRESFKKIIPVVTNEDLQPDIDRIANGDTSPILCGQPISGFITSTATTGGEMKQIPTTEDDFSRRCFYLSLVTPVMSQYVPGLNNGKVMCFMFTISEDKTPGGLVAQPLASFELYIQFLEEHWKLFCNDIRSGTINPEIVNDSSVREAVLKILGKANPELADFIGNECSKGWKGIITRLWPNAKYIETIVTGTMSHYIPSLEYYANGLPLVSTVYASSECSFGYNLKPLCNPSEVCYTFLTSLAYFGFFPISALESSLNDRDEGDHHRQQLDHELVDLVNVKLGLEYEVIVTTYAGLYRYRVGDVVRVKGFKNKVPQFSFVCRRNVILSVDTDKTDEVELQNAVENAVNKHLVAFDASLVDYTNYADMSSIPGHYILYWELRDLDDGATLSSIRPSVFEDCCFTIEESLSGGYHLCRASDESISPLEIKIVEPGTFDELMEYAVRKGASMNQYKTPRCIKTVPMVELMNSKVISSYLSQKCPEYVAGHKQWHKQSNQN